MILRTFSIAAILAGPASAVDAPAVTSAPQVYRLSPAERDAAIAAAALKPESPGGALLPSPERDAILNNSLYGDQKRDTAIHGEVGMFVGTGGARGIYGSTAVPLGQNGMAQFSFESSQFLGQNLQPYQWQRRQRQ